MGECHRASQSCPYQAQTSRKSISTRRHVPRAHTEHVYQHFPEIIAAPPWSSAAEYKSRAEYPILSYNGVGVPSKRYQVHVCLILSYDVSHRAQRVPLSDEYMVLAQPPSNPKNARGTKRNGRIIVPTVFLPSFHGPKRQEPGLFLNTF